MHKYQMSIHYFGGRETFTIEAEDKKDVLEKGRIYVHQNRKYDGFGYDRNDVKCEKKLRK